MLTWRGLSTVAVGVELKEWMSHEWRPLVVKHVAVFMFVFQCCPLALLRVARRVCKVETKLIHTTVTAALNRSTVMRKRELYFLISASPGRRHRTQDICNINTMLINSAHMCDKR